MISNIRSRLTKKQLENISYILIGVLVFVLLSLSFNLPFFNQVNNLLLDRLQKIDEPRKEIVVVGIDDQSLQKLGAWPWDYEKFTTVLNYLNKEKVAVVGVDVLFLENRSGTENFQKATNDLDYPLVLGSKIVDQGEIIQPIIKTKTGYVNFYPDSDGKIRTTSVQSKVAGKCYDSFSFTVFKNYLRDNTKAVCQKNVETRNRTYKTEKQGELKFVYSKGNYKYISYEDLYEHAKENKAGKDNTFDLQNKIILIGSTAVDLRTNLNDNFTDISGQTIPGVEIHANIVNSFLENNFRHDPDYEFFIGFSFVLFIIGLLLFKLIRNGILDFVVFVLLLIVSLIAGVLVYGLKVDWYFAHSILLLIAVYIYSLVFKFITEQKENKFVKSAFSQYINPKLLNQLIQSPDSLKLGGDKREMTVMFSDVRGFTTISEKLTATELVSLLNRYLDRMSHVVLDNDGTIDKYIGDAIMAFWNAPLPEPDHRLKALITASIMEQELKKFNDELEPGMPKLDIGIGINCGEMVVGNIGSSKRFDYTVLGDNVNLASRLEGLTKKYGIKTLISEDVVRGLDIKESGLIVRLVDEVIVKGKSKAVKVYQVLLYNEAIEQQCRDYEAAFDFYQKGQFAKAAKLLENLKTDKPAQVLLERIKLFKNKPPKDWKGIWSWLEK